ncbi:MAG: hypothetical protein ACRDD8_16165 [Bacteroidales bacterium]
MAISDIEKEIEVKKSYQSDLFKMRDAIAGLDLNTFCVGVINMVDTEINKTREEIDKMEFSIIQNDKNCEICSWGNANIGVIICQCFASKHNGTFVQKNYANKCKMFTRD